MTPHQALKDALVSSAVTQLTDINLFILLGKHWSFSVPQMG